MRFRAHLRPYIRTGAFLPFAMNVGRLRKLLGSRVIPVASALQVGTGLQRVDWDPSLLSIDGKCDGAKLRLFECQLGNNVTIRFTAKSVRERFQQMKIVADVAYSVFGDSPAWWVV